MGLPSRRLPRPLTGSADVGPSPARRAVVALLVGAAAGAVLAALVPRPACRASTPDNRPSAGSTGG